MWIIQGKEYPLGYTSYIAIQEECRFIDENLFKALLGIYEDLLHDFTKENLDYYHKGILIEYVYGICPKCLKNKEKKTLREASLLLGLIEDGAQSKLNKILEKLKKALQE